MAFIQELPTHLEYLGERLDPACYVLGAEIKGEGGLLDQEVQGHRSGDLKNRNKS